MKRLRKIVGLFCATLLFSNVNAAAMVVESPSLLEGLMQQYGQYVKMLEQAQAQVEKLNKINNFLTTANDIASKQTLTIANPLDVVDNLKNTLENIKNNAERLAETAKDYQLGKAIRNKRLKESCPFIDLENISPSTIDIDLTDTGEEDSFKQNALNVLEEFTDITRNDVQGLVKPNRGFALAELMCEKMKATKHLMEIAKLENESKVALLNNDFKLYQAKQQEKVQKILANEKMKDEKFENNLNSLLVRTTQMSNQLGVIDPNLSEKNGIKYCEKTKDGKGCNPILYTADMVKNDEVEMTRKAIQNSNGDKSQSQAEREQIMINYLREITSHMVFLNETMSLTAELIAKERVRNGYFESAGYDNSDYKNQRQELTKTLISNPELQKSFQSIEADIDKYGFPTFSPSKQKGSKTEF